MENSKKRLKLRYRQIVGASLGPRRLGLLRAIVELFTPERCRSITRSLEEEGELYRLNSEGERFLKEFLSLCQRQDLWELERETFKRNPGLNLSSLIVRMQDASKGLLEANDQCKSLPVHPEPAYGFPDEVWEKMVSEANETLIAYQNILNKIFFELHSLYTRLSFGR